MQTTLTKKIKPSQIVKLFDEGKINIRWYEKDENSIFGSDDPANYEIILRHNEDQDPKKLLNNAIKILLASDILDKEDFINEMLNASDYKVEEICEFANEHLQNLKTLEENTNLFINWIEKN